MKNDKMKEIALKVIAYIVIYLCINLYMVNKAGIDMEMWNYLGNVGSASIVYLIIFLGSDSVGYRLKEESPWKARMDKLTISKKAIIGHGITIVVFLLIAIIMDTMS